VSAQNCAYNWAQWWYTIQHRTAHIFPLILQTITLLRWASCSLVPFKVNNRKILSFQVLYLLCFASCASLSINNVHIDSVEHKVKHKLCSFYYCRNMPSLTCWTQYCSMVNGPKHLFHNGTYTGNLYIRFGCLYQNISTDQYKGNI